MIGALLILIVLLLCVPQKERWMTVVGAIIVVALWKVAPFFIAVFAYWMPSIRQHWVISWLFVSALIILPSMYFGTRSTSGKMRRSGQAAKNALTEGCSTLSKR